MPDCVKWKEQRKRINISTYIKCSKKKNSNMEGQRWFKCVFLSRGKNRPRSSLTNIYAKHILKIILNWKIRTRGNKVKKNARATRSYRNIQSLIQIKNETGTTQEKKLESELEKESNDRSWKQPYFVHEWNTIISTYEPPET